MYHWKKAEHELKVKLGVICWVIHMSNLVFLSLSNFSPVAGHIHCSVIMLVMFFISVSTFLLVLVYPDWLLSCCFDISLSSGTLIFNSCSFFSFFFLQRRVHSWIGSSSLPKAWIRSRFYLQTHAFSPTSLLPPHSTSTQKY